MELNRAIKFADKMVVLPDQEQCLIIETRLDVDKVKKTTFKNLNPSESLENIKYLSGLLAKLIQGTSEDKIYVSLQCSIKDK